MTGIDPACPNCGGEGWACGNHRDMPWEASGHAENCGAGAPYPMCQPEAVAGCTETEMRVFRAAHAPGIASEPFVPEGD